MPTHDLGRADRLVASYCNADGSVRDRIITSIGTELVRDLVRVAHAALGAVDRNDNLTALDKALRPFRWLPAPPGDREA